MFAQVAEAISWTFPQIVTSAAFPFLTATVWLLAVRATRLRREMEALRDECEKLRDFAVQAGATAITYTGNGTPTVVGRPATTVKKTSPIPPPVRTGRGRLFRKTDRTYTMEELNSWTKDELMELAVERDVRGRRTMNKGQLVNALGSDGLTADEIADDLEDLLEELKGDPNVVANSQPAPNADQDS